MKIHSVAQLQMVRCALLCCTCDLPAGKKACGFLCHSALRGCSRCLKVFPGGVGCKDYSGFKRDEWQPRTDKQHRSAVSEIQNSRNITQRNTLETKHGCRYSVLIELPYFDPTRMLVVDPMHNLFLGSAKFVVKKLWIDSGLLTPTKLQSIQNCIDSTCVPSDVGRIPQKVVTGFSGFTADQYKNWVTLYSIPSLYGIIEDTHLDCWRHLVLACRLLCKKAISMHDIQLADALLLQFCCRVERMYGQRAITPNMHMHCHYKDILQDYGPSHSFGFLPTSATMEF